MDSGTAESCVVPELDQTVKCTCKETDNSVRHLYFGMFKRFHTKGWNKLHEFCLDFWSYLDSAQVSGRKSDIDCRYS